MPLITSVPFFINAPQFGACPSLPAARSALRWPTALSRPVTDMFELMYDTDNYSPTTPQQLAYVNSFQQGTLALIATLPPGTGVFSPTCLVHCLSGQTTWNELMVTSPGAPTAMSLSQSLSSWYFNAEATSVVSDCTGWACITQCGVDLQTGLPCNMPPAAGATCSALSLSTDPLPSGWTAPPFAMPPWPIANPPPPSTAGSLPGGWPFKAAKAPPRPAGMGSAASDQADTSKHGGAVPMLLVVGFAAAVVASAVTLFKYTTLCNFYAPDAPPALGKKMGGASGGAKKAAVTAATKLLTPITGEKKVASA